MRKTVATTIALLGAALLLAGCATAPATPVRGGAASGPTSPGRPPTVLPDGATVHRDLAYGPDPLQKLDVYVPSDAHNAPILVMVHGGGWKRGDKAASGVVDNKVAHYLPMGYVVVSTNYRLAPAVNPVTEAGDVASALAWVQQHAGDWGGSAENVVLMGHSAGANLVSLVAADSSIAGKAGAKPWRGTIALDSAAFNVVTIMDAPHLPLYDPIFGGKPELQRDSSPTLRLDTAPAPMFLVCGSQRANSCPQASAFASEVAERFGKAAGDAIEVYPINMGHGEINAELGTPITLTSAVDGFLRSIFPENAARSSG